MAAGKEQNQPTKDLIPLCEIIFFHIFFINVNNKSGNIALSYFFKGLLYDWPYLMLKQLPEKHRVSLVILSYIQTKGKKEMIEQVC